MLNDSETSSATCNCRFIAFRRFFAIAQNDKLYWFNITTNTL
jgi:hypothetical protein